MKKTNIAKILSIILALVLIAVTALVLTGCGDKKNNTDETKPTVAETPEGDDTVADDIIVKGEGETEFLFYVTDANGKVTRFKILTDEETVGDALLNVGLISGEEGDYGLYVKVVNGTELDYNRDGKYWAFYVNGEYGMTGVDMTNIENGATYEFRAES
jgi:hypothetical protein